MPPALSDSESPSPSQTASPAMPPPQKPQATGTSRRRPRQEEDSTPENEEPDRPPISSLPPRNKRSRLLSGLHPSQDIIGGLSQNWDVPSTAPATFSRKTRARTSTSTAKKPKPIYNSKYHPMDVVTRPKLAARSGLVETIAISSGEEDSDDDDISQESRKNRRRRSSSSYGGNAAGNANGRGRSNPVRRSRRRSVSNAAYLDDVHPIDDLVDLGAVDSAKDNEDETEPPRAKKRKTVNRSKKTSKRPTANRPGDTTPETDETLVPGSAPGTPTNLTIEETVERIDAVIRITEELKPARAFLVSQLKRKGRPELQIHQDSERMQAHVLESRPNFPLPRENDFEKENFVASLPRENSHTSNVEPEETTVTRGISQPADDFNPEEAIPPRNNHVPAEATASTPARNNNEDVNMEDANYNSPRNTDHLDLDSQDMDDGPIHIEEYVYEVLNSKIVAQDARPTPRQIGNMPGGFTAINSSSDGTMPASSYPRPVDSTAFVSPQQLTKELPIRRSPTIRDTHLTPSQSLAYNIQNVPYNIPPNHEGENEGDNLSDNDSDLPEYSDMLKNRRRQRSASL
ncbi:uncharacterized protein J3D65DRAFT_621812 [Phyllosticta citribraziliensis]|uniref:Uncharacterized protein n=1 Tax=Phyllosticta citribraziliensis TaxID=989973 RepID=A0ABR1LX84_9PEZI